MDGPTTMAPGSAADCRRAAVLTASPVTNRSRSSLARVRSTSTSPVSMPMRSASAGRSAGRGSELDHGRLHLQGGPDGPFGVILVTVGTPKTASKASPANFSRVPS